MQPLKCIRDVIACMLFSIAHCFVCQFFSDSLVFLFLLSLIKMVYSIAAKSGERPPWHQLEHAIKRNFGGLVEGEPVEIFRRHYQEKDVSLPFVVVLKETAPKL